MRREAEPITQAEILELADSLGPVAYQYDTLLTRVVTQTGPVAGGGYFYYVPVTDALKPFVYRELEETPDLDSYIARCMSQAAIAGIYTASLWMFERPVRMIDKGPLIQEFQLTRGRMPQGEAFGKTPLLGIHEGAFMAYLHRLCAVKSEFGSISNQELQRRYLEFVNVGRFQRGFGAYVDARIAGK